MAEVIDIFDEVLPKLLKLQLFADFKADNENDRRILKMVWTELKVHCYKAGEEIIKEGERGEDFYILSDGKVQIFRNTMAGDRIALANLSADMGIFFGETALLGTDTRGATVVASTDCRTCEITGKKFKELCEKEPVLGYRVMLCLANRLNSTIRKANSDMATLYEALFDEVVN
ncbi:MAG: cyclic nucleotide-binding domain-containing protein [Treponema sp.]|nr:cyclic nucleotide-binding domain-containing protein [Treponema sp.]